MLEQLLLLRLNHIIFEDWFIRQFRQGLLPVGYFQVEDLRREYLQLCWKEEESWQKWSENASTKK